MAAPAAAGARTRRWPPAARPASKGSTIDSPRVFVQQLLRWSAPSPRRRGKEPLWRQVPASCLTFGRMGGKNGGTIWGRGGGSGYGTRLCKIGSSETRPCVLRANFYVQCTKRDRSCTAAFGPHSRARSPRPLPPQQSKDNRGEHARGDAAPILPRPPTPQKQATSRRQRPIVPQDGAHVALGARAHLVDRRRRGGALVDGRRALEVTVTLALSVTVVNGRVGCRHLAPRVRREAIELDQVAGDGHGRAAAPPDKGAHICFGRARR